MREAEIVAQAGRKGAVTIATNMAGRGTDIILGGNAEFLALQEMRKLGYTDELIDASTAHNETDDELVLEARERFSTLEKKFKEELAPEAEEVKSLGGLFIVGTERHESRRIDNQLKGRSGRQGDPEDLSSSCHSRMISSGYSAVTELQVLLTLSESMTIWRFSSSRFPG